MKLANNRRRETQLVAVDFVVANKMIGRRVAVRLEGNRVFVDGVGYSPTELRRQIAHLRRTAKTLASRRGPTAKDITAVLNEPAIHAKIMKDLGITTRASRNA